MAYRYLSADWLAEAERLLATVRLDPPLAGAPFTVGTTVTGADAVSYIVAFEADRVRLLSAADAATPPTVGLSQDRSVAVAIATGRRSAQAAFLAGEVQVSGDVTTLIRHAALVGLVGDVLAPLRSTTEFDDVSPEAVDPPGGTP